MEQIKKPIDRLFERFKKSNPKLYKRYLEKKNEVRKQPKLPGLKKGGICRGAGAAVKGTKFEGVF
jgi:hypothetical protein